MRYQISEMLRKIQPKEDLETYENIKSWIKKLMLPSLLNVFSTYNPLICTFLIHMNLKIISSGDFEFALVENSEKKICEDFELKKFFYFRKKGQSRKDEKILAERELEKSLRFLDTDEYLDTLSIESSLLKNPDKLFKLFNTITGGKAFKVPCRVYWDNTLKKWLHEYPDWHRPTNFHSLVEYACACIERGLWIKYWEMQGLDPRYPDESSPYLPQDSILLSVDSLVTLPGFFRSINKETREDIIGDIGSLTQTFQEVKQKLANVKSGESVPAYSNFFSCNVDNSKNYQNCKSVELILQVLKNHSEELFIEFLLSSPIDRTATIFDLTVRIIALRIKELHTQKIAEEIILQEVQKPVLEKKKKKKKKNNKNKNKEHKRNILNEEQSKIIADTLLHKVMTNMYEFIDKIENSENLEIVESPPLENQIKPEEKNIIEERNIQSITNESEFQIVNQKKKKKRRFQPQQKAKHFIVERVYNIPKHHEIKKSIIPESNNNSKVKPSSCFLWERNEEVSTSSNLNIIEFPPLSSFTPVHQNQGLLHQEIIQLANTTIGKIHKKMAFVCIVLEKINLIVSELFGGTIQLYGSYATGLAIDSSDIDIAVIDVKFQNIEEVKQACLELGNVIEILPFVVSCKKIITATVPVIKLEADSGTSAKVMIDITFLNLAEGCHLGLEAISFTKDLLILFPHILYLAIVLKNFLYSNNLNSVYHGNK